MDDSRDDLAVLAENVCWDLLRSTEVGRLAVCRSDGPDLFPVNFVVDHGTVVFRTSSGAKTSAVRADSRVAFEVDGFDEASGEAWSVVVRGQADEVRTLTDAARTADLPLHPWHGAAKNTFLRIVPETVSGRRFTRTAPDTWTTDVSGARRSHEE